MKIYRSVEDGLKIQILDHFLITIDLNFPNLYTLNENKASKFDALAEFFIKLSPHHFFLPLYHSKHIQLLHTTMVLLNKI